MIHGWSRASPTVLVAGAACSLRPLSRACHVRTSHALLTLFLILVPAPKAESAPQNPIVGAWTFYWGAGEQTTFFHADGTCDSPEYGLGVWSIDADGAIWFSERGDVNQYVMAVDVAEGHGTGWRWFGRANYFAKSVENYRIALAISCGVDDNIGVEMNEAN